MTPAQLQTLKTAIVADPVLNAWPNNSDGNTEIKKALELNAVPDFMVWKSNVSIREIGDAFVGTELAGLTANNQTRLQTVAVYSSDGINPALADRRAMYDDIFSGAGGTATRARLLILWKRLATRFEKLYATGTGSDAAPATLVIEGQVSIQDINTARNLP